MHVQEMIDRHPRLRGGGDDALARAVEACFACAQACVACADACLGEEAVADLAECIRLNLDCADVCLTAGKTSTRRTGSNEMVVGAMLDACAVACARCAEECARHGDRHDHCRLCAEACRICEAACRQARAEVGSPLQ